MVGKLSRFDPSMSAETTFVLTTDTLPPGFELVEVFGLIETTYTQMLQKGLVQGLIERNRNERQEAIDHFRRSAPSTKEHFRQLAHEIHEMGGEASIFSVAALDVADERRMLQTVVDARTNEYNTVVKVCSRFLGKAAALVETQNWNDQVHAEFAEVLEKVHVLFRTAKRHDMLGTFTASRRAAAAESLAVCEQVFRVLLDQEYARTRRLLEMHSDLLPAPTDIEPTSTNSTFVSGQTEAQ